MNIAVDSFKPNAKNHILNKLWDDEYGLEFKEVIKKVTVLLDTNNKLKEMKRKLFLNQTCLSTQQLNQYVQSAVEFTVVKYFAYNFPEYFKYEKNLVNGTDIESQFNHNNLTFNVEVKASSYINNDYINKNELNLQIKGHFDNYKELQNVFQLFAPNFGIDKRYDNKLGSHLKSTQSKLPIEDNQKYCNVLIIGCNDSDDIQKHYDYLFLRAGGLFSENPLIQHSEFDLVDIVFFSNLFFKHNSEIDSPKLNKQSWQFEKSFIIGFRNPYRKDQKLEHLNLIEAIIPNHTKSFMEYKGGPEIFRLKHFIHTELGKNRNIYHY